MNGTTLIAPAGFIAAMAPGAVPGFGRPTKGKVAGMLRHMMTIAIRQADRRASASPSLSEA